MQSYRSFPLPVLGGESVECKVQSNFTAAECLLLWHSVCIEFIGTCIYMYSTS